MLLIPLSRKNQIGIPPLTILVILICLLVYVFITDEAGKLSFAYYPATFNPLKMLSSVFVHEDIFHILGNLFFFYCFSRAIEIEILSTAYLIIFLTITITTHILYSLTATEPIPTIGLSGVVWGFMGIFLMRYPKQDIRCFVWYLWVFKVIEVPSYIFVLAFLAFDYMDFKSDIADNVNHIAHIGGFFVGVFIKLLGWNWLSRR